MKFKHLGLTLTLCSTAIAAVPLNLADTTIPPRIKTPALQADVIIAIIDTGAELNHPAFKHLLWSNPGETGIDSQGRDKSSNGIDDDTNGFIDDVHGWNFVDNSKDLKDQHGHGTHIAGIIAATASKSARIKFMMLKYFDTKISDPKILDASNRSVAYAIRMGAHIINYSGGGDQPNPYERDLYTQALHEKILVVAAAGNESRSNDFHGFYPASYGFENIISVASLDAEGHLLNSSNYGSRSVDVGALGKDVMSALPGQRFGKLTGTSQATAIVTGVIASLISSFPNLKDVDQIKARLIATSATSPYLKGKIKTSRIPDVDRATSMKDANELTRDLLLAESRVKQVFDDPVNFQIKASERDVSSEASENLNNPPR